MGSKSVYTSSSHNPCVHPLLYAFARYEDKCEAQWHWGLYVVSLSVHPSFFYALDNTCHHLVRLILFVMNRQVVEGCRVPCMRSARTDPVKARCCWTSRPLHTTSRPPIAGKLTCYNIFDQQHFICSLVVHDFSTLHLPIMRIGWDASRLLRSKWKVMSKYGVLWDSTLWHTDERLVREEKPRA